MATAPRTRRILAVTLAPLGAAALVTPAGGHAQAVERHAVRGAEVALYNVAGRARLVAATGDAVTIELTRRGRDASQLRVETGEIRGRQTLRVIYPDDDIVYPEVGRGTRTSTRIRDDGTFGDGGERNGSSRSRQIEIRGDGRGTEAWADMTVGVPAGQRLLLHLLAGDVTVSNVDGNLTVDVASAGVTAERTRGRLFVDAGSGGVRVSDAEGEVTLDLGSGPAEVRGMKGSLLKIDAGSGPITGSDIDAPTVDLDLGSGRTRVSGVRARTLRVNAGSGSVDVGLVDDVEDVRIDAGSGSITLRVPPSLGAELDIDAGSGGIDSDVPITVTRRERGRLVGRIGDGRGRISIDTGSGGVRLARS